MTARFLQRGERKSEFGLSSPCRVSFLSTAEGLPASPTPGTPQRRITRDLQQYHSESCSRPARMAALLSPLVLSGESAQTDCLSPLSPPILDDEELSRIDEVRVHVMMRPTCAQQSLRSITRGLCTILGRCATCRLDAYIDRSFGFSEVKCDLYDRCAQS